jgi:glycine hydroxymethyltransferase
MKSVYGLIYLGTPAMTTRGFKSEDFVQTARFVDESVQITRKIIEEINTKSAAKTHKLKDFKEAVGEDGGVARSQLQDLKKRVVEFSRRFPVIGFDAESMKYRI